MRVVDAVGRAKDRLAANCIGRAQAWAPVLVIRVHGVAQLQPSVPLPANCSAPILPVTGLVMAGFMKEKRFSDSRKGGMTSQRSPAFTVSLGVSLKSSFTYNAKGGNANRSPGRSARTRVA